MKKLLMFMGLLMFLCSANSFAQTKDAYSSGDWLRCTTGTFDGSVAVTDTNTTVTFTKDTKAMFLKNRGANEVYVDPRDGVAVADDDDGGILINAGESRDLSAFQTHKIGLIASSAESTSVQLDACW